MTPTSADLPETLQRLFLAQTRDYALILMDPEGRIVGWRGAAERIFGHGEAEVLGQPVSLLFTTGDRARGLDRHELAVALQDSQSEDDRWHLRKDGTRIWVTGTVRAVRGDAGEVLGFVKVLRDRTDLRMQLEALENELEVATRTRERTNQFLRSLGHEIRNPLSPLQSSAQILERLGGDERIQRVATIMQGQIDTLRRLADDLMETTRLDMGRVELNRQRMDLRPLVEDCVIGHRDAATHKGVRIEAVLPPQPLYAEIDRERFQQVLNNLVSNAIKYTPAGGRVWCKATTEADEAVLRVEDTGMGIDPALLPMIFDLFTRDPRAEQMEPSGMGIGLDVVRQVVKLHGGTVQVRSAGQGRGAEFTVRLPVSGADPGDPAHDAG
ncbi:PAS domain-containing sensor histidine kinase [Ramlibacter tataouinensis]|uniref:PAS domain-containing sensor histidine kinase n=1 Tax=Ramlibacter tataouinensis TaxID=94132 RepID=UPI0022F3920E|nr:PAS domain-containing sensor histidine kinase [Ramlibacter tataouinensis]WBY02473.1 PAS domain-containing sensor histidine kinase [Ramlibacter tataouinensis]